MKLSLKLLISLLTVATLSHGSASTLEIRPLNGTAFAEIGKSFSFECVFNKAGPIIWYNNSVVLAICSDCNSPCKVNKKKNPWGKAHATCDPKKLRSILTLTNLIWLDHTDSVACQTVEEFAETSLLVGSYSKLLHPQNSSQVPVLDQDFSLVCDIGPLDNIHVKWFNEQGKMTAHFIHCQAIHKESTSSKYAPPVPGRNITCNSKDRTSTLTISPVQMSLDGTTVGCFDQGDGDFYLYTFTVHAPVETVEIQPFNDTDLIEGREKTFVCLVGKSKPSPWIEWVINKESGSSRNVTSNAQIFHEVSGKFFKSKSVLKLTLHQSFKTLLCKATVANLPWVESENMELNVKFDVKVYIIIGCLLLVVVLAIFAVFLYCRYKRKKQDELEQNHGYHMIRKDM